MVEIRVIDASIAQTATFRMSRSNCSEKIVPSYNGTSWTYELRRFESENVTEMRFPDEHYEYGSMTDSIFPGTYDDDTCIGPAILQPGFFKYMYLYDLKVSRKYRGHHIGQRLIQKSKEIAVQNGYCGLYKQGQDNNPGACLFYLNSGFYIGGLDTNVYRHTKQEGKADILFYCEADR